MQAWIADNKAPPASRFPRVSDGTLVPPLPVEKFGFPAIPGVAYNGKYPVLTMKDYKVQPPRGIPGTDYPALAPKVDADGNDISGIRSVALEVPAATYMGWNHQRAGYMENDFCYLQGSTIPFAKTATVAAEALWQQGQLRRQSGSRSSQSGERRFDAARGCGTSR
jgi:hypothetical protein